MPCYDPPLTDAEIILYRKQAACESDWKRWYRLTPARHVEQWLCDALRGNPPHADCLRWWELHKQYSDNGGSGQ